MGEPSSLTDELFCSVFQNDLTWTRIAGYLNPSDLKPLRQCSKLLLYQVNSVPQFFIDKFQVQISSESYNEAFLQPPAIPTVEWKHAKIELSFFKADSDKIRSVLGHILPHLESVVVWDQIPSFGVINTLTDIQTDEDLEMYQCRYSDQNSRWDDERDEAVYDLPTDSNVLYFILKNSTNMLELTMHYNVMWLDRVIFSIWEQPPVLENLSRLKKLVVTAHETKYPVLNGHKLRIPEVPDGCYPFEENIETLLQLTPRLESFSFENIDPYFATVYTGRIYDALWPKRELLRELKEFHDFNPRGEDQNSPTQNNGGVEFPLLNHLSISGNEYEDFVMREINVHSLEMKLNENISEAMIASVFTRPSLRALKLSLKMSEPCTLGTAEHPLEFKNLEEFEMIKESDSFFANDARQAEIHEIIESISLPVKIKKLGFQGIGNTTRAVEVGYTVQMNEFLKPFENLTYLSFWECQDALNDQILQTIFQYLQRLRVLKFSESSKITSFGLTGIREGQVPTGISINLLKGLRELRIRDCEQLASPATELYVQALKFLELKVLDFIPRADLIIPDEVLCMLARQNPSLEQLYISACNQHRGINGSTQNPLYLIRALKNCNPRIKKVHYIRP